MYNISFYLGRGGGHWTCMFSVAGGVGYVELVNEVGLIV